MALITRLEIENFRCFRKLAVGGLTRVNLIVGANNSGKTALLEATEIFATDGAESRLWWTANRRGEVVDMAGGLPSSEPIPTYDLRGQFFGRPKSLGGRPRFSVGDGLRKVVVSADIEDRLQITDSRGAVRYFSISSDAGVALADVPALSRRVQDKPNVIFVPAGDVAADVVRTLWSEVAGNDSEALVHQILALVDPRVERLVVAPVPTHTPGWGGVFLRLKGEAERVPLAEFGDGMKKATQMGVALVRARSGVLLVDELDDGLHYSILSKLWQFLVQAARVLDVQVFATTHSKDCLEAIAQLYERESALADDISVHRLSAGEEKAFNLTASEVRTALSADMDPRGQGVK